MSDKIGRGPSPANKAAERYLSKNPNTPAKELAKKFKLDLSTIYKSPWWGATKSRSQNEPEDVGASDAGRNTLRVAGIEE